MGNLRTPDGFEARDFLDPVLYPDLIEDGGLTASLRRIAHEVDVDLGAVEPSDEWGRAAFVTARLDSGRGPIAVLLGLDARRFSLALGSRQFGRGWAEGNTSDLVEVVRALGAWRDGVRLRDLAERFPFVEWPPISQAYEDGTEVETQWSLLSTDPNFSEHLALIEELHADPVIAKLFPFFSMGTLRLAKDGLDNDAGEIVISPSSEGGGFTVHSSNSADSQLVDDAHAVAALTRSLVAGLGPYPEGESAS